MSCLLWESTKLHNGYARVWRNNERFMLHRRIYEDAYGALPDGWDVHHKCGVKNCVNLAHLEAVQHATHAKLHNEPRTHCPQGHPMTPENVYHYGAFRHCKICRRVIERRYVARKRAREIGGAANV